VGGVCLISILNDTNFFIDFPISIKFVACICQLKEN
jgi:hypothetical protein